MRRIHRKYLVLFIIVFPLIITFAMNLVNTQNVREVEFKGSYSIYDFNELKEKAQVIAIIEVNDDLNVDNSVVLYNDTNHSIEGFWAKRNVSVIKYIKNQFDSKSSLSIIEPAAITRNSELLKTVDYEELKKGERYLVFLSNENLSNQLSIISANNGKFNMENFEENKFPDVFEQANNEFSLDGLSK